MKFLFGTRARTGVVVAVFGIFSFLLFNNCSQHGFQTPGNSSGQSDLASQDPNTTPTPTPVGASPTPTPSATPVSGLPQLKVDVDDTEHIGPFSSWLNVKSLGAVGDGVHDDTTAIQNGLNQVAHSASGPAILYFPAGTYRITNTLNYNGTNTSEGNGMGMIGENPATTTLLWDGASGANMLVVNGGFGHRFSRLTWDGKSKANIGLALWWDASTNMNYGGSSRHTDEVFKDMAIGIMAGRLGANYGQLDSEGQVYRLKFLRMSKAGITTGSWNALDWWIWDSEFTDCYIGVTNIYTEGDTIGAGNFLVYRSLFQRSTGADIWIGNTGWFSAHKNVSIGSKRFFHSQPAGYNGARVTLQNNRVVDTADPSSIYLGSMGPIILIDNQIRSKAGSAGPVVKLDNFVSGSDVISIGNSYTINNIAPKQYTDDRILSMNDQVVSSSAISADVPTMPAVAANKNRQVFEVGATVNATTIQAAINSAVASGADNPVVHINPGTYNINATITIPAGKRIQLSGDSTMTGLNWTGAAGGTMLAMPGPSLATVRDIRLVGGNATAIQMTNADQDGGRIFASGNFFGVATVSNLAKTRLSFQANTTTYALNLTAVKSMVNIGGGIFPVKMAGSSNLSVLDAWYEGSADKLWESTDGTGNFSLVGGHMGPADAVHGGVGTNPSFAVNGFSGNFALVGVDFDLERVENGISVGAENANTVVCALGINANKAGYFKRTSSGGSVGLVSSQLATVGVGDAQAANIGSTDNAFLVKALAQARGIVWDTAPSAVPTGSTDVRFINVTTINTKDGLKISN